MKHITIRYLIIYFFIFIFFSTAILKIYAWSDFNVFLGSIKNLVPFSPLVMAYAIVIFELGIGCYLVIYKDNFFSAHLILITFSIFTFFLIIYDREGNCFCFGNFFIPFEIHLVLNLLLIALSVILISKYYKIKSVIFFSITFIVSFLILLLVERETKISKNNIDIIHYLKDTENIKNIDNYKYIIYINLNYINCPSCAVSVNNFFHFLVNKDDKFRDLFRLLVTHPDNTYGSRRSQGWLNNKTINIDNDILIYKNLNNKIFEKSFVLFIDGKKSYEPLYFPFDLNQFILTISEKD